MYGVAVILNNNYLSEKLLNSVSHLMLIVMQTSFQLYTNLIVYIFDIGLFKHFGLNYIYLGKIIQIVYAYMYICICIYSMYTFLRA